MSTTSNIIRTIRMDEAEIDAILDRLDGARLSVSQERRHAERYSYRAKGCIVHMQAPGAGAATAYQVPTREISDGGLSFLHGGFVHPGTRCEIQLISTHGTWKNAEAKVIYCKYVEGLVHEVGVEFEQKIDPAEFCSHAVKTRVLLAEDDASMTRLAKLFLQQLNAEVDHAENGRIALELAMKNMYDVILMDMEMPVMSGFEAVEELRSKGYTGIIVAATALTQPVDRQKCLEAGCDRYLKKPYDKDSLSELIESLKQEPLLSSMAQDRTMIEIVDAFVEELPPKLREIEEAFAKEDDEKLERLSRSLKGEAGSFGFEPITLASEQVEKCLIDKSSRMKVKKSMEELIKLCCLARSSVRSTKSE